MSAGGAPGGQRYWAAVPAAGTASPSRRPVVPGLAVALLVAAIGSGCGQKVVDDQNLEGRTAVKIASVVCPTGIGVEPGRRFDCVATARDGRKARVRVLIRNEDADV